MGENYRGVHLTVQLSKIVEKPICTLFVPLLESIDAFGPHQYAYTKGRGYRDTLTINVCNWLTVFWLLYTVAMSAVLLTWLPKIDFSLSSISWAYMIISVASSLVGWQTGHRKSILGGHRAAVDVLANSVFQGTVLGYPLWNAF